ncbi:Homoserine dehydrogenase [Posidoniimonas polymericola]|uniref:Homoserine dehydrogenase n=1 Tax=Posidoniimonas polymericola TaxID=2528002 RepID=A0A5C5YI73_9BACT|nr:homoserine dehydrogenase [Posidoniimonas polymericola]TWT74569.1 Homoserine dehydrogenase [Posidoniimonas polymericola]
MEKTKVGIIGLGTVGSGVAKILLDHGDRTARHAGRVLWLEKAAVRDLSKPRDCDLPDGVLTDSIDEVIDHPEIKVVAQLMGGIEPARSVMIRLLESGKDVVTANKALLAEHGPELFDKARELGRSIAFEASVAGGIPIIANLSQCLTSNQVTSLHGILNGTSNFILDKMHTEGAAYSDVVAEAQRLGYAEADPSMDVDGTDAAQKLAILCQLAFGARLNWRDIPRSGIDTVDLLDVNYAQEMGYKIKLLAIADLKEHGLDCEVNPALVRAGSPLGEVGGPFNAVLVKGDAVGPLFYHGQGAGQMPTASAVAADLIDTAVGRTAITFRTLGLWSDQVKGVDQADFATSTGKRYVRAMVEDSPGVLAKVTEAFGAEGISIASILQKEPLEGDTAVPLVVMTHRASEAATDRACAKIAALDACRGEPVKMWVRD